MQKMIIAHYGKEADLFEAMLNEKPGAFLHEYSFAKKPMPRNPNGFEFTVTADQGIVFYFMGKEFERRMMIHHLQNYSFHIIEDWE